MHARTHGHTTHTTHARLHARLHAPHPRCSGSGDHDGRYAQRLGASVAVAATVAAVMGRRRRGRHERVWHGWMRCGTGSCGGDDGASGKSSSDDRKGDGGGEVGDGDDGCGAAAGT